VSVGGRFGGKPDVERGLVTWRNLDRAASADDALQERIGTDNLSSARLERQAKLAVAKHQVTTGGRSMNSNRPFASVLMGRNDSGGINGLLLIHGSPSDVRRTPRLATWTLTTTPSTAFERRRLPYRRSNWREQVERLGCYEPHEHRSQRYAWFERQFLAVLHSDKTSLFHDDMVSTRCKPPR